MAVPKKKRLPLKTFVESLAVLLLCSAAALAGFLKVTRAADAPLAGGIVCTLTGHGLKDPDRAVASAGSPIRVEDGLAGLSRLIEQAAEE